MIDHAGGKHRAQHAMHHVVETRHRYLPRLHRIGKRFAEILVPRHLHVEPRQRRLHRRMRRLPVGHHKSGILPVALEHVVQKPVVLAGPIAVHFVVRAHDAGRVADPDADLKRQKVAFACSLMRDQRIHHRPPRLLVVHGVVLDVAHHLVLLHAHDQVPSGGSSKHGIFAWVLKQTPVPRVTREIHTTADRLVVTLRPQLAANHIAVEMRRHRIPRRGRPQHRRQQRGIPAPRSRHAHTYRRIGLLQRRNAKPRNAKHLSRAAVVVRRDWVAFAQRSPSDPMHQLDLFSKRKLLEHQIRTLVRRKAGICPRVPGKRVGRRRLPLGETGDTH